MDELAGCALLGGVSGDGGVLPQIATDRDELAGPFASFGAEGVDFFLEDVTL
jgi:hypothetical protein